MELRHLRYFVAVAESLNFRLAAQRLHVSQPPLSQQIRLLEDELGVQLLQRTKRSVSLTEAGKLFLEEARITLAHAAQAMDTARRAGKGELGRISVGFVSSADVIVVPKLVPTYRRRYPKVDIELLSMNDVFQRTAVVEGRIAVGFTMMPWAASGLVYEKVHDEALIVAMPECHKLASLSAVPMEALAGEPYIIMARSIAPSVHDFIITQCLLAGFSPNIIQEVDHVQFNLSLVSSGIGVSLLAERVQRLPREGVVYRPVAPPAPRVPLGVIYKEGALPEIVEEFLALTREVFEV